MNEENYIQKVKLSEDIDNMIGSNKDLDDNKQYFNQDFDNIPVSPFNPKSPFGKQSYIDSPKLDHFSKNRILPGLLQSPLLGFGQHNNNNNNNHNNILNNDFNDHDSIFGHNNNNINMNIMPEQDNNNIWGDEDLPLTQMFGQNQNINSLQQNQNQQQQQQQYINNNNSFFQQNQQQIQQQQQQNSQEKENQKEDFDLQNYHNHHHNHQNNHRQSISPFETPLLNNNNNQHLNPPMHPPHHHGMYSPLLGGKNINNNSNFMNSPNIGYYGHHPIPPPYATPQSKYKNNLNQNSGQSQQQQQPQFDQNNNNNNNINNNNNFSFQKQNNFENGNQQQQHDNNNEIKLEENIQQQQQFNFKTNKLNFDTCDNEQQQQQNKNIDDNKNIQSINNGKISISNNNNNNNTKLKLNKGKKSAKSSINNNNIQLENNNNQIQNPKKLFQRQQQQQQQQNNNNINQNNNNTNNNNNNFISSSNEQQQNIFINNENQQKYLVPEQKSNNMTPSTINIHTPQQRQTLSNLSTPFKDPAEDEEDNPNSRKSRGLRQLSLKVKDIVCELRETSYKQVAERLIQDLEEQKTLTPNLNDANVKEEQNVKRRVYDALNVLIAADVLKKNGKTVYSNQKLPSQQSIGRNQNKPHPQKVKQDLQERLNKWKQVIESKRNKVKDLLQKFLAIKNLQERNKKQCTENDKQQYQFNIKQEEENNNNSSLNNCIIDNEQQQQQQQQQQIKIKQESTDDSTQSISQGQIPQNQQNISQQQVKITPSRKRKYTPNQQDIKDFMIDAGNQKQYADEEDDEDYQPMEKLKFPLIAISSILNGDDKDMKFIRSKDHKRLKLLSKRKLDIYGDLDLVMFMGFHQKKSDTIMKLIQEGGLEKYIDFQWKD